MAEASNRSAEPDTSKDPRNGHLESFSLCQVLETELDLLHPRKAAPSRSKKSPSSDSKKNLDAGSEVDSVSVKKMDSESIKHPFPVTKEEEEKRLREVFSRIHQLNGNSKTRRTALCFSGGGIRSATFCLGVMQGLVSSGVHLSRFTYLSTVSGGGYIGSWLSAMIYRLQKDTATNLDDEIEEQLFPKGKERKAVAPEPSGTSFLRSYSNFLTPKLGLFSADTWTLISTYIRNLLLNWTILVPLLAVILIIPRIYLMIVNVAPPCEPWSLRIILSFGVLLLLLGLFWTGRNLRAKPSDKDSQSGFILKIIVPFYLATLCLATGWGWYVEQRFPDSNLFSLYAFVALGASLHLVSVLVAVLNPNGASPIRKLSALDATWRVLAHVFSGAFAGLVIGLIARECFDSLELERNLEIFVCFGPSLLLAALFLATALHVALVSKQTSDEDREWWARSAGWMLIVAVFSSIFGVVAIFGPDLFVSPKINGWIRTGLGSLGGASGILTIFAGASAKTGAQAKESPASKEDSSSKGGSPRKESGSTSKLLTDVVSNLAAPIFALTILAFISFLTSGVLYYLQFGEWAIFSPGKMYCAHIESLVIVDAKWVAILTGSLIAVALAMGLFVDANRFSLHAMYRSRLIRAYLGASNPDRYQKLDRFTGFNDDDNIDMSRLTANRPFHVINIALNLVGGARLAWQTRKAQSFTVTPLHCGSCMFDRPEGQYQAETGEKSATPAPPNVTTPQILGGYRRTDSFRDDSKKQAVTLGGSMTVSGAAVSPNMGYHSSTFVTFLLALFNARLGIWFPNPKKISASLKSVSPRFSPWAIVAEALGLTGPDAKFVYLSDGGHFENLGLYEMVLRRCHTIVCVDATEDSQLRFDDLARAIQRIRVDLGIEVVIDLEEIRKKSSHVAFGKIRYSEADRAPALDGTLICIKPLLSVNVKEPMDVISYAQSHPGFPHDTTADQWFDEDQFESYRMLGFYSAGCIPESPPEDADLSALWPPKTPR